MHFFSLQLLFSFGQGEGDKTRMRISKAGASHDEKGYAHGGKGKGGKRKGEGSQGTVESKSARVPIGEEMVVGGRIFAISPAKR